MHLAIIDIAQAVHVTALVDHEEVFGRVALFLAAVVFLLFFWIDWVVDRELCAIIPKVGSAGMTFIYTAASHTAKSSAV
jgi:hypothetical protein